MKLQTADQKLREIHTIVESWLHNADCASMSGGNCGVEYILKLTVVEHKEVDKSSVVDALIKERARAEKEKSNGATLVRGATLKRGY